ncbi:Gfo/Idh/MocA family oxidoreductase [Candidatus Pelagibacter ubique]|jgi:hypothetical protein|nr:Gfo/Idh/MocA family oxidoreductase [Candidatus Pelagibacter ubique]
MNILIIGSNFGSKIHLDCLSKLKGHQDITICSPNIFKKKNIKKNIKKVSSYEHVLQNESFDLVICATTPLTQYKVIKFIFKMKIRIKGLVIEKPIANNFKNSKKCIDLLNNAKIPYIVNFIFSQLDGYHKLKSFLQINQFDKISYKWRFQQAYFRNRLTTWKIVPKLGGGLVKFYAIHAIYHMIDLLKLKKTTKININKINNTKGIITSLIFDLIDKNNKICVEIFINSKNNIHSLNFENKAMNLSLINKSKDWTKKFKLMKNRKFLSFKEENRTSLSRKNINILLELIKKNKKKINKNYIDNILLAHYFCEKIQNKIKNIDNCN